MYRVTCNSKCHWPQGNYLARATRPRRRRRGARTPAARSPRCCAAHRDATETRTLNRPHDIPTPIPRHTTHQLYIYNIYVICLEHPNIGVGRSVARGNHTIRRGERTPSAIQRRMPGTDTVQHREGACRPQTRDRGDGVVAMGVRTRWSTQIYSKNKKATDTTPWNVNTADGWYSTHL